MRAICNNLQRSSREAGFTFIELLVTTTIIAILITIVSVSFQQANRNSRDARRKADLQQVRGVLENYRLENGTYPGFGTFETSSDGTFLSFISTQYRSQDYVDPLNNATYYYRYRRVTGSTGCSYELGAFLESNTGQACSNCAGSSNAANYYCISD